MFHRWKCVHVTQLCWCWWWHICCDVLIILFIPCPQIYVDAWMDVNITYVKSISSENHTREKKKQQTNVWEWFILYKCLEKKVRVEFWTDSGDCNCIRYEEVPFHLSISVCGRAKNVKNALIRFNITKKKWQTVWLFTMKNTITKHLSKSRLSFCQKNRLAHHFSNPSRLKEKTNKHLLNTLSTLSSSQFWPILDCFASVISHNRHTHTQSNSWTLYIQGVYHTNSCFRRQKKIKSNKINGKSKSWPLMSYEHLKKVIALNRKKVEDFDYHFCQIILTKHNQLNQYIS